MATTEVRSNSWGQMQQLRLEAIAEVRGTIEVRGNNWGKRQQLRLEATVEVRGNNWCKILRSQFHTLQEAMANGIAHLTSSIPTAMAMLTWHPQYPQLWHSRQERSTSRWNRTQRGWRGQDRTEPTPSHRTPSLRKYGRCRIKGFENTIEVGLKALEIPRSRI